MEEIVQYKVRSLRQEQAGLAADLRAHGKSWAEIASVFRSKYRVNARVAFRLAHGWSQRQAADEWNRRWPDEPKTLKSFSYWEVWPSSTGHEPSLEVLNRLANLYHCSVADLVIDLADYSHLDATTDTTTTAVPLRRSDAEPESNDPSVLVAVTNLDLPDNFVMMLMKHPEPLVPSEVEELVAASRVTKQKLARLTVSMRPHPLPAGSRASLPSVIPLSQETISRDPGREPVSSEILVLRQLVDVYDLPEDGPVRPLSELHQATETLIAWRLNSNYTRILGALPRLLPELTRALTLLGGAERTQVAQCLVQAYRAADAVADKFGYYDLSAQIIGVMRWAAEQSGDPLATAVTSYVRGETFFADGQMVGGRRMLERAADQLAPGSSAVASAIYGSLHMRAAVAAARAGLPALARDHLAEAQDMAHRVTDGVFLGTAFGPGSVRIHEVTLALDLQQPETALAVAAGWSPPERLSAERRSHFYVDIAQAQMFMGRHESVLDALHTARTIAPEHICAHPQVLATLTTLVRSGKLTENAAREFFATARAASDFRS
ncbi:MAG TPA: hypothetical protein VFQ77_03620 [Pseudonocardiaceae bacterium]|jgi:hypothetical protein|nr:hypothetical protein [Pseudonocardiaceae bacterium]